MERVLSEEILLAEVSILVGVSIFYEFLDVVVTDDDVEILVENLFDFGQSN